MSKNANTNNSYLGDDFLDQDMIASVDMGMDQHTISIGHAIAGAGNYAWNPNSSVDWANITVGNGSQSGRLQLQGADADIMVNGRSLMDAIDALEQRLNILVPNPELEDEWDELRRLGELYRELERKCKEKGEMWKKLKSMPPPDQL